ncbi:MAG: ribosome maturation factor RimP [Methylohalobius sp.]|nr:ribosome maturation factor RimP [Methylohalobius sp.]
MNKALERLTALLAPVVEGLGYELVGMEWDTSARRRVLRLYIDAEDGIRLDDCERVSAQVSAVLDVEDPIAGAYLLEVSSPGLDRPLFTLDHFRRFAGQKVQIKLKKPMGGQRRFAGMIVQVKNDLVVLIGEDGREIALAFADIDKAKLLPDYQAILKG